MSQSRVLWEFGDHLAVGIRCFGWHSKCVLQGLCSLSKVIWEKSDVNLLGGSIGCEEYRGNLFYFYSNSHDSS